MRPPASVRPERRSELIRVLVLLSGGAITIACLGVLLAYTVVQNAEAAMSVVMGVIILVVLVGMAAVVRRHLW